MAMGRAAAACLRPDGTLDASDWTTERSRFRQFVVED
jgi:hypothetical protein